VHAYVALGHIPSQ